MEEPLAAGRRGRGPGHLPVIWSSIVRRGVLPRWVFFGLSAVLLIAASRVDPVAAGVAAVAIAVTALVCSQRSRGAARVGLLVVAVGTASVGLVAALGLPAIRAKYDPLVVRTSPPSAFDSATVGAHKWDGHAHPGITVLGFAASDYDDTAAAIDADASAVSIVAATGITLGAAPGTISVAPAADTLVRGHLNGAHAYAVVTNYDGTDFNGKRALELFDNRRAERRFVTGLAAAIGSAGWDGVVLDLENLPPAARALYPKTIADVRRALGGRPVVVSVPAFPDPSVGDALAYDMKAISTASDQVVLMTYDEHDDRGSAGPIGSAPWVNASLAAEIKAGLEPGKTLLGVAGYGYAWTPGSAAPAQEVTISQAQVLAAQPGANAERDPVADEWHVRTADGRDLWFPDDQSVNDRSRLVRANGLAGIALWRLGSQSPTVLQGLSLPVTKFEPSLPARPLDQVQGTGVVALTFDDGPDPKWTRQILRVLRQKRVPATFFVVGKDAERYQHLVRAEAAGGDIVGSHTYSHLDTAKAPLWRDQLDISGGTSVVEGILGRKPLLFRAPYGEGDSHRGKVGADELATNAGLHPVGWNDDPQDWTGVPADTIVRRVLAGATERTVVLLHDGGGDRSNTVAALPRIIDSLRTRGYVFTTVDGLDGSILSPYAPRSTIASTTRLMAIVAAFRLQLAARKLLLWVVLATAALGLARVFLAGPLAGWHRWRTRRPLIAPDRLPTVSVLVPARNEATVIAKTVTALRRCRPRALEVIVIDDGSTDGTEDEARRAAFEVGADEGWLTVVRVANGGKAPALNAGIRLATGDVVVVIDADTVVDPGIVSALAAPFTDPRIGAVAGNVKVGNRRSLFSSLQALEYIVAINLDRRAQDVARVMAVVPGAAGAFRRQALLDVGGYPTDTLVEDADLTVTLLRAGWRIPYEPRAIAWTEAPERMADVVRQRRRWSYGTIEVVAKHRRALLDVGNGPVGLLGLPWMLLAQVVLPVLGPLADVYLCWLGISQGWSLVVGVLLLALVADLCLAAAAVWADGERPTLILLSPLLRLVWRPVQLWVVVRSFVRWSVGEEEPWRKVGRYNSVSLEGRTPKAQPSTLGVVPP